MNLAAEEQSRASQHACDNGDHASGQGADMPGAVTPSFDFDHIPFPAVAIDSAAHATCVNQAWRALFGGGAAATACPTADWLSLLHPVDILTIKFAAAEAVDPASGGDSVTRVECRIRSASGAYRWFLATIQRPAPSGDEWVRVFFCDIDAQVADRASLENESFQRNRMLDASVDCIKIVNLDGTVRHLNRSGRLALGVPLDETEFGMKWLNLLPPEVRQRGQRALAATRKGHNARFAGKSVIPGRKPQYWDNILTPLFGDHGRVDGILCVSRDVTVQREARDRLRSLSEIDSLTGLFNRRSFRSKLTRLMAGARERGGKIGLILIDLDHFKHINDTLGHAAGDQLLRVFAKRLSHLLDNKPGRHFVARLGGDEFVAVLDDIAGERDLTAFAAEIQAAVDDPICYAQQQIHCGVSIGCSLFPDDGGDVSGLLRCADIALFDLKAGGRGGHTVFSAKLAQTVDLTVSQRNLAWRIIRENAVEPFYQPKVRLSDAKVVGFEALLRWRDEDGRVQPASSVIEAFKDYELAAKIGAAIQNRVFADIANWRARGLQVLPVAINAAPVEFLRNDFAEKFLDRLRFWSVPPELVEVEITEHILAERGAEYVVHALEVLKREGVRIVLDDFGTGQSALSHLKDYPVDGIKIDLSFTHGMVGNPSLRAIVEALVKLGPSLDLYVVAEGIETPEHVEALRAAGCLYGQGRLYADALPAQDAAAKLEQAG